MPRCNDQDWAMAENDPDIMCWCEQKDCMQDAAREHNRANENVLNALIPLDVKLQTMEENGVLVARQYKECARIYRQCRGLEPASEPFVNKDAKKTFKDTSRTYRNLGPAMGFGGLAVGLLGPSVAKPAGFMVGAVGVILLYVRNRLEDVANDPPDSDFLEVVQPSPIVLPRVEAGEYLGVVHAQALNRMVDAHGSSLTLLTALSATLNRAQGASLAGDDGAKNLQLTAARDFALESSDSLIALHAVRAQSSAALADLNQEPITVTWEQASEARTKVLTEGWPRDFLDLFDLLSASAEERESVLETATIGMVDVNRGMGPLKDRLVHSDLHRGEADAAFALREFATP